MRKPMDFFCNARNRVERGIWNLKFKITGILSAVIALCLSPIRVLAADTDNDAADYSFLQGSDSNAAIDGITTKVQGVGASTYKLVMAGSVAVCIICLIIAFASIGFNKAGQKREESKSWIFNICVAIAGICGALAIFSGIKGFVSGI